jgi:hypothetical protein
MLLSRVLSACKKNNIEVKNHGYRYRAIKGNRELVFYENGLGSGNVTHFTLQHPETNASVDLFMDSYFNTLKHAIKYLNAEIW